MNKQQAVQKMKSGLKVRHKYFSPEEWVEMKDNFNIIFEDGTTVGTIEFWKPRQEKHFEEGWSIHLTHEEIQKVKDFIEENMFQNIEPELVQDILSTKALQKFFKFNLEPYISPKTGKFVRAYIHLLNK